MQTLLYLDGNILLWIQEYIRQDWLTPLMQGITMLGEHGIFVSILALIFLCFRKTRKVGVIAACGLISSYIVNNLLLKNLVARIRPYDAIEGLHYLTRKPHDFSFPSGHSAIVFVMAVILFRRFPKKIGIPALLLATLVSFSRLYLGVHYPTDVLAGVVSGIILGYLADRCLGAFLDKKSSSSSISQDK